MKKSKATREPIGPTDGERVCRLIVGHMRRQLGKLNAEHRQHVLRLLRVQLESPWYQQEELAKVGKDDGAGTD